MEKRFSNGVAFKTSYTWAKAMGSGGARARGGDFGHVQDHGNARLEKAVTGDHLKHRFVATWLYELPFGRGKRFGSGMSGVADKIVGGWSVAGVANMRSSFHSNSSIAAANCNSATTQDCRPDVLSNPHLDANGVDSPRWDVNALDYPRNPARARRDPRYGTAGSNILVGNGINNIDLSLLKNVRFNERFRAEFRWESFNAFNHPSFASPTSVVDNPRFGRVFSTQLDPRVNQFGLKLYW